MSGHFFGEGNIDRLGRPYYLGAFLEGVLETWHELKVEVEAACLPAPDPPMPARTDSPPGAPPESSSAHSTAEAAVVCAPIPFTEPCQRHAATLVLAEVDEAPELLTPSPPPARPTLSIVRAIDAAIDVITGTLSNMVDWLFKEHTMDYNR